MKLKQVKDLNFLELKKEAKLREVYVDKMTLSAMTNAVQKHREENPDFVLSPKIDAKTSAKIDDEMQASFNEALKHDEPVLTENQQEMKTSEKKAAKKKAEKNPQPKKKAAKKAAKKVTVKSKKETIAIDEKALLAKPSVKKIMAMEEPKHKKIFLLNKEGISKNEISIITGATTSNISRDLLFYKKGKY